MILTKVKSIAVKVFTGLTAVAAAVFYVLFRQSKDRYNEEKLKELEKEVEEQKAQNEAAGVVINAQQEAQLAEIAEKKKNEEIKNKVAGANNYSSHNALVDGLRK